jgi:peptide/nickel transport system ATP-binding protein
MNGAEAPNAPRPWSADRQAPGTVLEIDDLRTYIRLRTATVQAVDGVSFNVKRGETVGVVGESGCGKTMTGMSIMRLLPNGGYIAGGAIRFDGVDLASADLDTIRSIRGNKIGMVFQDPMTSLNPTMTIGKQIAEPVRLHQGASRAAALERATEVLDLVGMPRPKERLADYPHQLSGGLRQRVMIAMALACEPTLLIADEPTTALDVTIQAQILALLDDLKAKLGMAMILITHDMGVIAGRADRTVVMYAGQVVETADTAQLFEHMRHPYTEALLASIPQLDQDKTQRLYSIPGLPPDLTHPPGACRFAARCAYATDMCRTVAPPLGGPDPDHPFACHYPRSTSIEDIAGAGDVIAAAAAAMVQTQPETEMTEEERVVLEEVLAAADVARAESETDNGAAPGRDAPSVVASDNGPVEASLLPEVAPLLEYRHVSKEFVVTAGAILQRKVGTLKAVTDVSLAIEPGETIGIVGESGCGKTTLGRMGVALEVPTEGQVLFKGVDLASLSQRQLRATRRSLQLMFQDPYASLDPRMRVDTIIEEPMVIQGGMDAKARKARVRELLDEVGLSRKAAQLYPHEFSGGQRQRIGLARALALNPAVIVADEPVSALDVSIRSQILNLMKRLQFQHGLTYMLISHDLSVVRYLADRIGVMYLGKLIEMGTGDDIYSRPAHPYTAGLLATIPVPKPAVERAKKGAAIHGELPSPLNPPSGCRFRTRCPRAQQRCAEEVPLLTAFGGDHVAACHFPLQAPVTLTAKAASA